MRAGLKYLQKSDPAMAELIRSVGPCTELLQRQHQGTPFAALVRAIISQQLSGAAAATILGRVLVLARGDDAARSRGFPKPEAFMSLSDQALRGAGLSRAKLGYVRDLCRAALAGEVPSSRRARQMRDDELIDALTTIKGIGRWSVEMLLIFHLGRLDILPVTDLGIRKGYAKVYKKRALPSPSALLRHGERWRPYRTIASWYLWRSLELPA